MTCDSPVLDLVRPSVDLGVNLLVEEALGQDVELAVLLPDGVCSHKLELLQGKLIKLVLHLPDVGLLQLGRGLLGGGLLLRGLPQVGLLPYSAERVSKVDRGSEVGGNAAPHLSCRAPWRP